MGQEKMPGDPSGVGPLALSPPFLREKWGNIRRVHDTSGGPRHSRIGAEKGERPVRLQRHALPVK
jgi:hypothetical protein